MAEYLLCFCFVDAHVLAKEFTGYPFVVSNKFNGRFEIIFLCRVLYLGIFISIRNRDYYYDVAGASVDGWFGESYFTL